MVTIGSRRGGTSLVEGIVYFLLVVGLVGFLVAGYRFYTVQSAGQSAEAAELREATLFMERLRRILRFGVVRIVPTAGGIRVIHWTMGPDGTWRLVETLFENSGERGVLIITDPDGNQRVYHVGQSEDGELTIEAVVDGELVRVTLDGVRVLTQILSSASTRHKGESWIVRQPGDPGTTIEEVLEELRNRRDAFPELPPAPDMGDGDRAPSGLTGLIGEDQVIEGEASPTPRGLSESWADEADLVGIEASPIGQLFLPPEPPPGTGPTPPATLRDRLQDGGLGAEKAEAVGGVLEEYEAGVLTGDRRQAGQALSTLTQLAAADGMSLDDLSEMIASTSDVGQAVAEENPDAYANVQDPDTTEVPPTLGSDLPDIPAVADLPGDWGGPPTGPADPVPPPPLDSGGTPPDPGDPPPDNFDPAAAKALCLTSCNAETGGNPLCGMGCDAAVAERQANGPISEPCASECLQKFEPWACSVFCQMN